MTDERLFERLAAHAGPGDVAPDFENRLYAQLLLERRRSGRTARLALLLVAALLATLAISAALAVGSGVVKLPALIESPTPSAPLASASPTPAPTPGPIDWPIDWRGPVPRVPGEAAMIPLLPFLGRGNPTLTGPPDVSQPWVDITDVSVGGHGQVGWTIRLAESPPKASGLDPNETLIAYGLVVETTGDEVADYVIGISNEVPMPRCCGDLRVWVTNLATGHTNEVVGGPYGYPVDFSYPGRRSGPTMYFFFLSDASTPTGLSERSRFYAWASQTSGTDVIAWDYEPEQGWPE